MMMMAIDKGGGGGDNRGEGMQCSEHPYRNNPDGICTLCLQEKLRKLVSSSKSNPSFFPIAPSSSSSSPSFRSEGGGGGGGVTSPSNNDNNYGGRRSRFPFLVAQNKSNKLASSSNSNLVLKRSKSSAAPRRHFLFNAVDADEYSPRKRWFWSFLHISPRTKSSRDRVRERDSKPSIHPTTTTTTTTQTTAATTTTTTTRTTTKEKNGGETSSSRRVDYGDENESPNSSRASSSSFGRKVARSRSVGCGSRSFSGDFLERISTGFGDCTLRRVESQRESKPKIVLHHHRRSGDGASDDNHHIKERVRCGGIFGGFSMTSSSFSSSSSYWLSSSSVSAGEDRNGRTAGGTPHGRGKSWNWAFASPMRAFSTRSSKTDNNKDARRDTTTTTTTNNTADASKLTPNLDAIPSLLTVRG